MMIQRARRIVRWVRRLPDRVLHPRRRAREKERLGRRPLEGPVLFLCHGNICRSPYAEHAFRMETGASVPVSSAGFILPGRRPPENARRAASERGVALGDHRSRVVDLESARRAGLVVVMEPDQARAVRRRFGVGDALVLGDLDPSPVARRPIRDPVQQPLDVFRDVYDRIDRCVGALASTLPRTDQETEDRSG